MRLLNQKQEEKFEFTQGERTDLALLAVDDEGRPFRLEGATLTSQVMGIHCVGPVSYGNSWHTLGNQGLHPGTFTLNLDEMDTHSVGVGGDKEIITHVVIRGVVTTFRGDKLLTVHASELPK